MLNVKDSNEGKSVVFKVDKVMRQNENGAENNSVVDVIWRCQKSHLFIVYHRINYMSFQHLTSIMSRFKLFKNTSASRGMSTMLVLYWCLQNMNCYVAEIIYGNF